MKATKRELYDFIDSKINGENLKANKELHDVTKSLIKEPLKEKYAKPYEPIKRKITVLMDDYTKFITDNGIERMWDYQHCLGDLSNMLDKANELVESKANKILSYIKSAAYNPSVLGLDESYIEDAVRVAVEPIYKKLNDLKTLERELTNVVRTSSNGKQAYTNLVALGVDMKDFENSKIQLPAVQKLSVDTCLINGGC